ncbi:two-component system, chemotaxis family, response regulator CheY [Mariprofundus ferrinatatus]|uniref:Two-component system, chemotaxis family, response regulator CheY n=1 Tax=Mariprofundus ferrinatatus TaxID=1921087 RepID=A0A2K8L6H7_9PROT|nr:response regulator [Mariprofundus ferrinatatus]ATX82887.1 two-component system, chemotaxis family, response regulator CheY [Mariprofundus ferrinatatus]
MRALIVDDSKAMRMIIGRTVKALGFEIIEACHGREALERLQDSGTFDVALVDWNMPEMNGYEFICAVRADAAYNDMKIVMVTTEAEMSQVIKALEAGANEYIMKPFTKEMIQEKLQLLGLN